MLTLITFANGVIVIAVVKLLIENYFRCVLIGRHEKELKSLKKAFPDGIKKYHVTDFSNLDNVIKTGKAISKEFKTIDLLINIAGIGIYKPLEEVTKKDWEDSFTVGNSAPYFLSQTLLPNLEKSDLSVIINIGSGMGEMPAAGRSVYCSMKFALRGQTLSLAEEFKHTKPRFVLLTLGSVLTSFGPLSFEEKKKE